MLSLKNCLRAALIPAAALLCACAETAPRIDWIDAGPVFPAVKADTVVVAHSKAEITRTCGLVGLIHGRYYTPGNTHEMEAQISEARKIAASKGANVILVKENLTSTEGLTGVGDEAQKPNAFVSGMAFKYADNLTPEEKKIVEHWNLVNGGNPRR